MNSLELFLWELRVPLFLSLHGLCPELLRVNRGSEWTAEQLKARQDANNEETKETDEGVVGI